jgi:hypothetical protein
MCVGRGAGRREEGRAAGVWRVLLQAHTRASRARGRGETKTGSACPLSIEAAKRACIDLSRGAVAAPAPAAAFCRPAVRRRAPPPPIRGDSPARCRQSSALSSQWHLRRSSRCRCRGRWCFGILGRAACRRRPARRARPAARCGWPPGTSSAAISWRRLSSNWRRWMLTSSRCRRAPAPVRPARLRARRRPAAAAGTGRPHRSLARPTLCAHTHTLFPSPPSSPT